MAIARFLAAQMRQPEGWFGKLFMGYLINRASRRLAQNTVQALNVRPADKLLEIGFGGGVGLRSALSTAAEGKIFGVDISPAMVEQVQGHFQREIEQGRLMVQAGDVAKLPFESATFDGVFAINNIYFWADAVACLQEVRRVLKGGGKVGIGIRSKEHMSKFAVTKHGFRLFSAEELEAVLRDAGFRDVIVQSQRGVNSGKFPDQVIGVGVK